MTQPGNKDYPRGYIVKPDRTKRGDEAFIPEERIVLRAMSHIHYTFCTPDSGDFAGKGLLLNPQYDWVIVKDDDDRIVLVATRKL